MKSLIKLLILFAAFAVCSAAQAQNVIINNNTPLGGGQADFHYNGGCPTVSVPLVMYGTSSNGSTCTIANFDNVSITFSDFSCTPAVLVFSVTLTPSVPSYTYTDCSGTPITFTLSFAGTDIIVDIN
jgi:hypothetical protein